MTKKALSGLQFHVFFYTGSKPNSTKVSQAEQFIGQNGGTIRNKGADLEFIVDFVVTDAQTLESLQDHQDEDLARYIILKLGKFVTFEVLQEYVAKYNKMSLAQFAELMEGAILDPVSIIQKNQIPGKFFTSILQKRIRATGCGRSPDYVMTKQQLLKQIYFETTTPAGTTTTTTSTTSFDPRATLLSSLRADVSKVIKAQGLHTRVPWKNRASEVYNLFQASKEDATTKSLLFQTLGLDLILTILEFVPLTDMASCSKVSRKFGVLCKYIENEQYKKMNFALCSLYGWVSPPKKPTQQKQQQQHDRSNNSAATTTTTTTTTASSPSSAAHKSEDFDHKKFFFKTVLPLYHDTLVLMHQAIPRDIGEWKQEYLTAIQPGLVFNGTEYIRALTPVLELPIGATKYGGCPDLPTDMEWPQGYQFICQINLSADLSSSLAVKRYMPTLKLSSPATSSDHCNIMYFFFNAEPAPLVFVYSGPLSKLQTRSPLPEDSAASELDIPIPRHQLSLRFMEIAVFPELSASRNDTIMQHFQLPTGYNAAFKQTNQHMLDADINNARKQKHFDSLAFCGTFLSPVPASFNQGILRDQNDIVLLSFSRPFAWTSIVIHKDDLKRLKFDNLLLITRHH